MKYEFDWSRVSCRDVLELFACARKSAVVGEWSCGIGAIIEKTCPEALDLPIVEWADVNKQFFDELIELLKTPGQRILEGGPGVTDGD